MGNKLSQNTDLNADLNNGEIVPPPIFNRQRSASLNLDRDHSNVRNSGVDNSDWEDSRQPHVPIARTSSHSGYRPRSASLRRIRSIQRRRYMQGTKSKTKTNLPSGETAKIEAENQKQREEKALLAACARGDLSKVEKLVDSGVDVNSLDSSKMTALHYAAMHARDDVIKCLISRGAEVNTTDMKGGSSAMHWVVNNSVPKYGSIEGSLTALIKAGCNVNATDFNFATPLHMTAKKGDRDGVQVLLKLGADPNKRDITGRSCFEVAKNDLMKHYMRTLLDSSSKKDNHTNTDHIYHVLARPLPSLPPSDNDNQQEEKNTYHVLEAQPYSTPVPYIQPPKIVYAGKSYSEEHIYSVAEFHSPPPSPSNLITRRSTTPSLPLPPLPHRHCQHQLNDTDSQLYNVLDHFPTKQSGFPSPPRRRKIPKH